MFFLITNVVLHRTYWTNIGAPPITILPSENVNKDDVVRNNILTIVPAENVHNDVAASINEIYDNSDDIKSEIVNNDNVYPPGDTNNDNDDSDYPEIVKNNDFLGVEIQPVADNQDRNPYGPVYNVHSDLNNNGDMDTAPSENIFENLPTFTRETFVENPRSSTRKSAKTGTTTVEAEETTTEYKSVLLTRVVNREPRDTTVHTTAKTATTTTTTVSTRYLTTPTTTTRRRIFETAKYFYHTTTSTLPSFFNLRLDCIKLD